MPARYELHAAASMGNHRRVEQLLKAKQPVDELSQHGVTPLFVALNGDKGFSEGHEKVANMLLKAGANPHLIMPSNTYSSISSITQRLHTRAALVHEGNLEALKLLDAHGNDAESHKRLKNILLKM